ncbi:hypothetical protein [Bacillus pumilus]|uniref:hypothetical protein n=1 Tax=Bacillus pumilus TaxID=1408 RepID=UPI0021B3A591|nr:hypothetical protein [Bacillus pumilus]
MILRGDLCGIGWGILKDVVKEEGIEVGRKDDDWGLMMYRGDENVLGGGSGCGC